MTESNTESVENEESTLTAFVDLGEEGEKIGNVMDVQILGHSVLAIKTYDKSFHYYNGGWTQVDVFPDDED